MGEGWRWAGNGAMSMNGGKGREDVFNGGVMSEKRRVESEE